MADTTVADNIVTAKAGTVIAENKKLTLSTPSGSSITPNTMTAMVGINQGTALQKAPSVTQAESILSAKAASGDFPANVQAAAALANLTSQSSTLLPPGNHAAFGSYMNQAQGHIDDSIELKQSSNFMANSSFSDYGSGVESMSDLTDQGMTTSFGDLNSASNAMTAVGPCYDTTNMSTFGTGTGLVQKINKDKLGNSTGLNAELTKNGVDLNGLEDPVYAQNTTKTLQSINDPKTISTVKDQFGVTPPGNIENLNDFNDVNKMANPSSISGFQGSTADMGQKFGDMGARFENPAAASSMMNNISKPSVPTLDGAYPTMSSMVSDNQPTIDNLTGTGSGALGTPNMTDFTQSVSGGPDIDAINSGGATTENIAALEAKIANSNTLFDKAGIDTSSPPPNKLSSSKNFATSLHKFGQNSETSGILSNMAVPNSKYGDSIKASLAEGKNNALMQQHGIRPPYYGA
jgi:hypothetical protein